MTDPPPPPFGNALYRRGKMVYFAFELLRKFVGHHWKCHLLLLCWYFLMRIGDFPRPLIRKSPLYGWNPQTFCDFFRESSLCIFLFLMKMESVNDDVGTLLPDGVTDLAAKTFFIPQPLSYKSLVTLYFVFFSGAYRRGAFRDSIPPQPTHL